MKCVICGSSDTDNAEHFGMALCEGHWNEMVSLETEEQQAFEEALVSLEHEANLGLIGSLV